MSLPSFSPENNIGTLDRYFEGIDFASATENLEAGSDLYYDWERTVQYVLERGEGECAV